MIHYAAISPQDHHRGQDAYAAATIARAPAWARRSINAARVRRGLPVVLGPAEGLELEAEVARARRAAASRAIGARPTRSPSLPATGRRLPATRRPNPPATKSRATTPTKTITRVMLTAGGGLGRWEGQALREWIERGAFGSADEINARGFSLVADHHDGPRVAVSGRALRVISTDHPRARLVVEWIPDLGDPAHRRLLSRIESGTDQVSMRSLHHDVGIHRIPRAARVVKRATLAHLCLLEPGRQAAYPGSVARVFRDKPDTVAELTRQIGIVTTASSNRASAASWGD
jgi:hypothetical protein